MSARIEIVAEDVAAAHAELVRMMTGSEEYKKAVDDAFSDGRFAQRFLKTDEKWSIEGLEDLVKFIDRIACLAVSGTAKEHFPDWSIDKDRCFRISKILRRVIETAPKGAIE